MELSDYDLIKKSLNGQQDAFEEIVTRYKKLIYGVVYNMVPDKQDVNDVSQEVFIRIYKSLDRYNPEYKFSTWSVRIATNLCLDILRKKKIESVSIDGMCGIPSVADTPETRLIEKEQSKRIQDAVDELPEKYRIPIILFHRKGLSYEEITRVLDQPMTIIKNRLYRARLMLKDKLSSERKEGVL